MPDREHDAASPTLASGSAVGTGDLPRVQALIAEAVRAYSDLAVDSTPSPSPLPGDHELTQTDVLRLVSALLETVDVEVFELAMWQLWSPR